jgi:hypothetical protein
MTDVETAQKVLAQLTDQRDRAVDQVSRIEDQRQSLAYTVYANGDERQKAELTALNNRLAELAVTIENLDVALAEARRRLAAAHEAVARTDASERCKRIEQLLLALGECASPLDVSWGRIETGQAGGFIHRVGPKNPPLFERAGTLIAEIVVELRALRLDRGVAWPSPTAGRGFGIGTAEDLRRAVETAVKQYALARLPGTRNFVNLIEALATSVRAAMREQTNSEEKTDVAA